MTQHRPILHQAYLHGPGTSRLHRLYGRLIGFPLATDWLRARRVEACLPGRMDRVLDVGCGNGMLLFSLAGRHPGMRARAIDRDPDVVRRARRVCRELGLANVTVEESDGSDLAPGGASYDTVLLMDVLTEVEDQEGLLARIHGVLEPGGSLVLGNAMPSPLRAVVDAVDPYWQEPRLHRAVRSLDLFGLLARTGFRVERRAWLAGLPFGVPAHCADMLFYKSRGVRQVVHGAVFPLIKAAVALELLVPPILPTGIVVRATRS